MWISFLQTAIKDFSVRTYGLSLLFVHDAVNGGNLSYIIIIVIYSTILYVSKSHLTKRNINYNISMDLNPVRSIIYATCKCFQLKPLQHCSHIRSIIQGCDSSPVGLTHWCQLPRDAACQLAEVSAMSRPRALASDSDCGGCGRHSICTGLHCRSGDSCNLQQFCQ